jgi:hypothetical protein
MWCRGRRVDSNGNRHVLVDELDKQDGYEVIRTSCNVYMVVLLGFWTMQIAEVRAMSF